MTKSKFPAIIIIFIPVIILGACWYWMLSNCHVNELESLGVHIEWQYGATSSMPSLKVWWQSGNQRVNAPNVFGGIDNPRLSFRDFDGDGIKDIVFGNRKHRQVVAFHPSNGDRLPTFAIIEVTTKSP